MEGEAGSPGGNELGRGREGRSERRSDRGREGRRKGEREGGRQ